MSKGQHGNREAKKPKRVPGAASPLPPVDAAAVGAKTVPDRWKKK